MKARKVHYGHSHQLFDVYSSSHLISMFYIVTKDKVALRRFYYWGSDPVELDRLIFENLAEAQKDYQRLVKGKENAEYIESLLGEEEDIIVGEALSSNL